jgi:hypothetical protein
MIGPLVVIVGQVPARGGVRARRCRKGVRRAAVRGLPAHRRGARVGRLWRVLLLRRPLPPRITTRGRLCGATRRRHRGVAGTRQPTITPGGCDNSTIGASRRQTGYGAAVVGHLDARGAERGPDHRQVGPGPDRRDTARCCGGRCSHRRGVHPPPTPAADAGAAKSSSLPAERYRDAQTSPARRCPAGRRRAWSHRQRPPPRPPGLSTRGGRGSR